MNIFRKWSTERKLKKSNRLYDEGYEYASAHLLHGISVPEQAIKILEDYLESATTFNTWNEFDVGLADALREWKNMLVGFGVEL